MNAYNFCTSASETDRARFATLENENSFINLRLAEAETDTYISGLTTPLSSGQVIKLNTLVTSLKTGLGISALSDVFDTMYILAGETAESSLRNLVKNTHHATAVNNPVFTPYEGFVAGATGYINTNYNPNTQGLRFTLNDASAGFYSRTEEGSLTTKTGISFGALDNKVGSTGRIIMNHKYNNTSYRTINTSDVTSLPVNTTTLGSYIGTRYNSTSQKYFLNKFNQYTSTSSVSTAVPNLNMYILAANIFGNPTTRSTLQISLAFTGKSISQVEVDVIHDAFEAYMDSNGKGVVALVD